MKILEVATALVILVLAALVVAGTSDLPYWSETVPGPAFAPRWVAAAGVVIAALLLLHTLRRTDHEAVEWPHGEALRRVLVSAASLWIFLALLPVLGFVACGTLFMLSLLLAVQRRRLVPSLITTIITVAGTWAIFGLWLAIDLPKGPLGL